MPQFTDVAVKSSGWRSLGITQPIILRGELNDDGWREIPNATGGFGMITFDAGVDFILFGFTSAGVVSAEINESTWSTSDTDGYYCLYQSGTQVVLKNRKGSKKDVLIAIWPM